MAYRPKVSRLKRGLDMQSSIARVNGWLEAQASSASFERLQALRVVSVALAKVARHELMIADYARAHNAVLDWVTSLPSAGGGLKPPPAEEIQIAQHPPEPLMDLHCVFSALVDVLHRGGFTYRECAELLDDGWGGDCEARTRRAMQRGAAARSGGARFFETASSELVKGECRHCAAGRNHPR